MAQAIQNKPINIDVNADPSSQLRNIARSIEQLWSKVSALRTELGRLDFSGYARKIELHDAVTVSDTASVDLTLNGQAISATVLPAGINHNSLAGLTTGNTHTQYALGTDLSTHADLTTAAHGEIVASTDERLTDARNPLAHNQSWSTITTDRPTTRLGYGITDAAPLTHGVGAGYIGYAPTTTTWASSPLYVSSGKIGYGTEAPKMEIHVSAGGFDAGFFNAGTGVYFAQNAYYDGASTYKFIGSGYASIWGQRQDLGSWAIAMSTVSGVADATITFTAPIAIDAGSPSGSFAIKASGKIGIGTSDPKLKLHVSDGGFDSGFVNSTTGLILSQNVYYTGSAWLFVGAGYGSMFGIREDTGLFALYQTTASGSAGGSAGFRVPLQVEAGALTNTIYVKSTSLVGFGTNAPGARVDALSTTGAQYRASYSASVYTDLTTSAAGVMTIAPTGGSTVITGSLKASGAGAWNNLTPSGLRTHVADPTGGTTVDTECRAAVAALLATVEAFGLHAAS